MRVICFDLDDTLLKEIDYLKSAYAEIAQYALSVAKKDRAEFDNIYCLMLKAYNQGKNVFECLNTYMGLSLPIAEYLQIYRSHKPKIGLTDEVIETLSSLKEGDCILGLITDGRSEQQRNKIKALELSKWIEADNIIISEEFGHEKPSFANYEYFMRRYPEASYVYVGDNLSKDFVGANALGWSTICLLDDGRNIHKQNFEVPLQCQPKMIIKNIVDLLDIFR